MDLSVGLTAAPTPLTVGNTLTYTITVTNNSDLTASVVYLSDLLPSTITLGTITVSQGTLLRSTAIVNAELGSIAGGGTATMTINVTPNDTTTLVDSVSVGSIAADPTPGNNTASLVTPVQSAGGSVHDYPQPDHHLRPDALLPDTRCRLVARRTYAHRTGHVHDRWSGLRRLDAAGQRRQSHDPHAGRRHASIGLVYSGDGVYQGGTFGTVTVSVGKANLTVMAAPAQATITYGAAARHVHRDLQRIPPRRHRDGRQRLAPRVHDDGDRNQRRRHVSGQRRNRNPDGDQLQLHQLRRRDAQHRAGTSHRHREPRRRRCMAHGGASR